MIVEPIKVQLSDMKLYQVKMNPFQTSWLQGKVKVRLIVAITITGNIWFRFTLSRKTQTINN
jgi:hypothetical protein